MHRQSFCYTLRYHLVHGLSPVLREWPYTRHELAGSRYSICHIEYVAVICRSGNLSCNRVGTVGSFAAVSTEFQATDNLKYDCCYCVPAFGTAICLCNDRCDGL